VVVSRNGNFRPEQLLTIEYSADCPRCGDHSFPVQVTGASFSIGSTEGVAYVGDEQLENDDPKIALKVRLRTAADVARGE